MSFSLSVTPIICHVSRSSCAIEPYHPILPDPHFEFPIPLYLTGGRPLCSSRTPRQPFPTSFPPRHLSLIPLSTLFPRFCERNVRSKLAQRGVRGGQGDVYVQRPVTRRTGPEDRIGTIWVLVRTGLEGRRKRYGQVLSPKGRGWVGFARLRVIGFPETLVGQDDDASEVFSQPCQVVHDAVHTEVGRADDPTAGCCGMRRFGSRPPLFFVPPRLPIRVADSVEDDERDFSFRPFVGVKHQVFERRTQA